MVVKQVVTRLFLLEIVSPGSLLCSLSEHKQACLWWLPKQYGAIAAHLTSVSCDFVSICLLGCSQILKLNERQRCLKQA